MTYGVAQPENCLGSLCVIGNNNQILMSIIKDAAPLTSAGMLRAFMCVVFSMDMGDKKWWAQ